MVRMGKVREGRLEMILRTMLLGLGETIDSPYVMGPLKNLRLDTQNASKLLL